MVSNFCSVKPQMTWQDSFHSFYQTRRSFERLVAGAIKIKLCPICLFYYNLCLCELLL